MTPYENAKAALREAKTAVLEAAAAGRALTADERNMLEQAEAAVEQAEAKAGLTGAGIGRSTHSPANVLRPDSKISRKAETGMHFASFLKTALVEGSGSGGYLVPEEYATDLWDLLAASSIGLESGFRVMTTGTDTVNIPVATADPAANWVAEAGTIGTDSGTYSGTVVAIEKVAALARISNELKDDSNPAAVEEIARQMARSMGLKADDGFFEGTGVSPEIWGMTNAAGNTSAVGGPLGSAHIATAIELLMEDNARAGAVAMSPHNWSVARQWKDAAGHYLLAQDISQPAKQTIWGIPVYVSSQLSDATVYVYDPRQVLVVRRADTRIELDTSKYFDSDETLIRGVLRLGIAFPNVNALCTLTGIS